KLFQPDFVNCFNCASRAMPLIYSSFQWRGFAPRAERGSQAPARAGWPPLPRPGRRSFPLAQRRVKALAISAPATHHHEPSAGSLRLMRGKPSGEHVLNNFSLLAANRLTHLKVVMLAFACMTLVVGFGLVHSALAQDQTSISTIVARVTWTIIRALFTSPLLPP